MNISLHNIYMEDKRNEEAPNFSYDNAFRA